MTTVVKSYWCMTMDGGGVKYFVLNGVQYMSVLDFIQCACKGGCKPASKIWAAMQRFHKEKFQGGLRPVKVKFLDDSSSQVEDAIMLAGASNMIDLLPKWVDKERKKYMLDTVNMYYHKGGLLNARTQEEDEDDQNGDEEDGSSTQERHEDLDEERSRQRKRGDIELFKLEAETKCEIWQKQIDMIDTFSTLCQNPDADDEVKASFKAVVLAALALEDA